jgi:hypothetical protein
MKKLLPTEKTTVLIISALLFSSIIAYAQGEVSPDTLTFDQEEVDGIFSSDETLDITITFDVTEYMRKKPEEYMDAVITFYYTEDDSVSYDIRLRSRGERRREICAFPPIRLNFKNTNTVYNDIDSMKNIKMVTHCNTSGMYDTYVLKEYLLYKMYNLVTDYSFRVRLLRVKYIDTGSRERFYSKLGFFIEPMDVLEKRLDVMELENIPFRYENMISDIFDRMVIFQYMIGNTDWQLSTYHNIKVVKSIDQQKAIAIPYDFDYSGYVNAPYAVPHEIFPITDVRQRYFMGACRPDSTYRRIIKEFMDNKEAFYSVKDKCELLDERTARHINDYLDDFFTLIEKDRLVNIFLYECKDR